MRARQNADLVGARVGELADVVSRRIALLCLLVGLPAVWQGAGAQSAEDPFARGARLQQEGDLEGAGRAYREAFQAAPDRIDALSNLALIHLNLGRPEEAIAHFEKARAAAPRHPEIPYFLGLAYFQAGRFADAEKQLAPMAAARPGHAKARHLYGLCLLKQRKFDAGIAALEKVIAAEPLNRSATYTLGSAYISVGRVDAADRLVKGVLSTDQSPQARLITGSVQLAKKDYQGALRSLRRAEQTNRELPMLHSQLGVALLYAGYSEEAMKEFESELALSPNDYNANAFLGWLYQQDGESDRAEKLLRRAYDVRQLDNGVRYLLAQVHHSRREWAQAGELLEQVVGTQPDLMPAHVMLARVYAKLKRRDEFRRERRIIKELNARQQRKDLQGVDQVYGGSGLNLPAAGESAAAREAE